MSVNNCQACGAPVEGLICQHCGALTRHVSGEEENRALDEFHFLLQRLADSIGENGDKADWQETSDKLQAKADHMLRAGFLPDRKDILIEAGIYCLPFLESHIGLEDAALSRLEGIITKLKLMPQDEQVRRAIGEFQGKVEKRKAERRAEDRKFTLFFSGCGLLLMLLLGGLVWGLVAELGLSTGICFGVVVVAALLSWLIGGKK